MEKLENLLNSYKNRFEEWIINSCDSNITDEKTRKKLFEKELHIREKRKQVKVLKIIIKEIQQ